jgi:Flp pilus assembly protein TadB
MTTQQTGRSDRDTDPKQREALAALVRHATSMIALSIVVALLGYGVAVWVWWKGVPLGAALIATGVFILFRLVRKHALQLSCRRYAGEPSFAGARSIVNEKIRALGHDNALKELSASLIGENPMPGADKQP